MPSSDASRPARHRSTSRSWLPVLLVGVALLAPALGGSTLPLVQVGVLGIVGWAVLVWPPTHTPGRWFVSGLGALLGIALLALLPVGDIWPPAWRSIFETDLGIDLGPWWTPQPIVTRHALTILAGGMLWLLLVAGTPLSVPTRWGMMRGYVIGATLLTMLALVAHWTAWQPALWEPYKGIGFFPNRNQMGNWLGLASILVPALVQKDWRRRSYLALGWLLPLAVFATALVVNGSRAGIVLFFGGLLAWLAWYGLRRSERKRGLMALFVGLSIVAVFVMLFFLFGGKALERFRPITAAGAEPVADVTFSARWNINRDAVDLMVASLPLGTGAGNFEEVFALYRNHSANEYRARHPESDWAWLAAETGPLGLLVAWALVALALAKIGPLDHGSGRAGRLAAGIAAGGFVLHGFVDVSGHRLGTALPAILLMAIAWHPRATTLAGPRYRLAMRGAALVVLAFLCWMAADALHRELLQSAAKENSRAGQRAPAVVAFTELAQQEPLNWQHYFARGRERVLAGRELNQARRDFQRARILVPLSPRIPRIEGRLWATVDPKQALAAFSESIRRSGHRAGEEFGEALILARQDPAVRPIVARLALSHPEMTIRWAEGASAEEFAALRHDVEARDPELEHLNPKQRARWFGRWARLEGPEVVADAVAMHPKWQGDASAVLAHAAARRGDYVRAYRLSWPTVQVPQWPVLPESAETALQLRQQLARRGDDYVAALRLAQRLPARERLSVLRSITTNESCPAYFHYMLAEAAADGGAWKEAWESLQRYQRQEGK